MNNEKPSWTLYLACAVLGGGAQKSFFLLFFSVDYINNVYGNLRGEFAFSLALSLSSLVGTAVPNFKPYFISHRFTMFVAYFLSGTITILLPLFGHFVVTDQMTANTAWIISTIGWLLLGFVQSIGGGSLYNFFGLHFGQFAVQAGQAGTVWGGVFVYIIRVILKLSIADTTEGFQISGWLQYSLVALVMFSCCFISSWLTKYVAVAEEYQPINVLVSEGEREIVETRTFLEVLKNIWPDLLHLLLMLTVSQSLYPGVFSILHGPVDNWFVTILFGFWGFGDAIGQTIPAKIKVFNHKTLWLGLTVQCLLIVPVALILQHKFAVEFFSQNWYAWVVSFIYGLCNGVSVCCSMMLAVSREETPKGKGFASTAALTTLQLAICLGSFIGILLNATILKNYQFE